ncbi:reverse transcriptase [Gossypium australe]|uniref:Reverse transcriptase n=1 Tax=Gossypium australe TaxID=47621 RepID=A0A5B6VKJ9_9ROSI|nr:reverse transcriptase [Gossypium australe]
MRVARKEGFIRGAKASINGPEITHLLFADDCILFGEAINRGTEFLKNILQVYESCSGQSVNFSKSTVFYSPNTIEVNNDVVSKLLGVRTATNPEKYLGLPNMNLVDQILMRIEGWSNGFLSQGGKEVFIKAVLQAIPTYAMSCFLLPNSLCRTMESIFAKFWWEKGKGRRGIHWCQWSQLCRPKTEGGLGFRNLAQFNVALLAKQGWRFLTNPNSLVTRVFKAKYFPRSDFINSQLGNKTSYVWRSIWAAKGVLEKCLIWKVGTGTSISIYSDVWVPSQVNSRLLTTVDGSNLNKVAELIDSQSREWNREIPHEDFLAWSGEHSGEFSVKSTYKLLQSFDPRAYAVQNVYKDFYRKLWLIDLPTKVKINAWKASWNYLPTRANLFYKKLTADALCPRCGVAAKTIDHLFRECPLSVEVWSHIPDTENSWQRPPRQVVKINFDGAFDKDSHQSASGIVARNSEGKVIVSSTSLHEKVDSAFAAEAIACRDVVQLGINMQKEDIIVKGDLLTVIKKCRKAALDKSQIGAFINDIHQMKAEIKKLIFDCTLRSANNLAHILATETLKEKEEKYLIGGVPYYAESHMRNESLQEPD